MNEENPRSEGNSYFSPIRTFKVCKTTNLRQSTQASKQKQRVLLLLQGRSSQIRHENRNSNRADRKKNREDEKEEEEEEEEEMAKMDRKKQSKQPVSL